MMRTLLLVLAFLTTAAHASVQIPANIPVVFHCELPSNRSVSIVNSADGLVYAYSHGENPELVIHGDATNVRYAYSGFSGGGGIYYRFIKGPYSYVVYSASVDNETMEGVKVYKGEEQIADKPCKENAVSNTPDYDPSGSIKEDDRDAQMTFGF